MQTYEVRELAIGENKGAPRVFISNTRLAKAGFASGVRYEVESGPDRLVLRVKEKGTRVVSSKKRGEVDMPVIDLNSTKVLGQFNGLSALRIVFRPGEVHLLPLASQKQAMERLQRLARKLSSREPLRVASVCHGGGVLSKALHDGFSDAGVASALVMANDVDSEVLYHAAAQNPVWNRDTMAVAAPLQELVTDPYLLKQVGHVDVLEGGLPCTGASLSGRAKKHLVMAEADVQVGHLVVAFLTLIRDLQPSIVLLENVPPYQSTASAWQLRHMLRDWGYEVHEAILEAQDFGCLEDRKRLCLLAVTTGVNFDFSQVERHVGNKTTLADILEPLDHEDPAWKAVDYLHAKEARDAIAGKGFRMQIVEPYATRIGTIGAEYQKARSTESRIAHPDPSDTRTRLLTPAEHAAAKGADPVLIQGLPATRAHRLLGNGVCPPPFRAVARALGRSLQNWQRARAGEGLQEPANAIQSHAA